MPTIGLEIAKIKIALGHLAEIAASWYNDQKDDLLYWDDDVNPEDSFAQSFVKYFATPERRHQWQLELTSLKQKSKEKVDRYTYQFKKLLKRIDPNRQIPPHTLSKCL